ncbi:DNA topoisomerase-1 [Marisediminicola sp. UYEF4]|uniref:DNA topoisomerase IB n=1 Tax=Marisediminicola sp. UYEF4 TaxID=1756384 RepID=UPI003398DA8F
MPRLRRSDSSAVGLRRVRAGRGYSYKDVDGHPITDPDLRARIEQLAIPPAWTDVWIAPYPNGHVQATGIDAAGRRQYIYHPTWREQKDRIKFDRALRLAESLPTARRRVTIDLRGDEPTKERALATAFRMLDAGSLRVGSERYVESNGSHGLSTLLCAHASVSGATVALSFPAKSGQPWESDITDADLAAVVRSLKRRGPRARLLAYRADDGWRPISAEDINDYVREQTGGEFTAKDFRTLRGTVAAAVSLANNGPERTKTARSKALAQAMRDAAEVLGNTPAIAKSSYVDPRVVDLYNAGTTIDPARTESAESELRALLYR